MSEAKGDNVTGEINNNGDFTEKIGIRMIQLFKVFLLVAIIMYSASVMYSSYEGMLGIYIWLTLSLVLTIVAGFHYTYGKNGRTKPNEVGQGNVKRNFRKIINFLPNFGCLVPVMLIIYVFIKIKPILNMEGVTLPEEFTWYNNLSFFLIILLFFMTGNFYSSMGDEKKSKYADLWSGGVLLFSVLAIFTTIKLYVISISFITDG
tara:strand:+ start:283 stop:897 length:615 start_codon:yes stop_codon:yes gene_type:complete